MSPGPLPRPTAALHVARCVARTLVLLVRREVLVPDEHVGRTIRFADGTSARVYRETRVHRPAPTEPCVLVVAFRLRAVRGRGHEAFEKESLLNTPLFVGFPGFVSKLWLAHDDRGTYRGIYEWDGAAAAERYARALWRVLELVSQSGSIAYAVLPGLSRADVLGDPGRLGEHTEEESAWWRVVAA